MPQKKSQLKYDRYARYAFAQPCRWIAIMALATKHFPKNLRQYAADQMLLRVVQLEMN